MSVSLLQDLCSSCNTGDYRDEYCVSEKERAEERLAAVHSTGDSATAGQAGTGLGPLTHASGRGDSLL